MGLPGWAQAQLNCRSEELHLLNILSLRTLVGGWAGWKCSAAAVAVAGPGSLWARARVGLAHIMGPGTHDTH